jgi:hypothetical protein
MRCVMCGRKGATSSIRVGEITLLGGGEGEGGTMRSGRKAPMWTFAVALGGLTWLLYVDRSLKAGFDKVDVGQSRERVANFLGKPSDIEECWAYVNLVAK